MRETPQNNTELDVCLQIQHVDQNPNMIPGPIRTCWHMCFDKHKKKRLKFNDQHERLVC